MILWGCQAHLLAGRLRLAVPGLRGSQGRARALTARLAETPGVRQATANPHSGRVLILFDPGQVTLQELGQRLGLPHWRPSTGTSNGQAATNESAGQSPSKQAAGQVALTGAALAGVAAKRLLVGPGAIARSMRAYDVAGLITVFGSYPYLRRGVARLVSRGQISGDLVIGLVGVAATILRENVLGLAALFVTSLSHWLQTRAVAEFQCYVTGLSSSSACGSQVQAACQPRRVCHDARPSESGDLLTGRLGAWSAGIAVIAGALTRDWRRALATLIAAAPSAVPLGASLPLSAAAVAARGHGVLIRHAEAVATASRMDLVLFVGPGLPPGSAPVERVRQARAAGRTVAVIASPQSVGQSGAQGALAELLREADLAILVKPPLSLVHAADVVVPEAGPGEAVAFLALCRRAARLGRQNQALAVSLNLAGLLLTSTGMIGPLGATLWHNLTTVAIQCSAVRLLPRTGRCKMLPHGPY